MDEKAIIDLNFVWFIPIMDPNMVLVRGRSIINLEFIFDIYTRIVNGASFCHVASSIPDDRDRDVITDGNHI
jgi:hypothetical protein